MKERPILFSAPMVRAILEGRKTQTRRAVKPQLHNAEPTYGCLGGKGFGWFYGNDFIKCPYGQTGDRLCPAMPIPSLNRNYCADVYGRIWSRARDGKTWDMLKGSPTSKGYLSVTPEHEGKYKTKLVHRLVAEAFYGYESDGLKQVRHLNGDQRDNSPENLDWGSQEDNWSDRYAHSRLKGGIAHHSAKLTHSQANEIKKSNESQRNLARKYGVAQATVWAIKHGLFWQDSPKPNPVNMPRVASRITLEITGIRVERLQDISEDDALAEGITTKGVLDDIAFCNPKAPIIDHPTARNAFIALWQSINGAESWAANPWVWVVEFKRVEK